MGLSLIPATRTILVALTTIGALGLAAPAGAADAPAVPPPDPVVIDPVTANGSGCPAAEATVEVDPGNTGFTLRHTSFFAHAGLGAGPLDFRKICQVNLQVNAPDGYTYAVSRGERDGFLHLPAGATALQRTTYRFTGGRQTLSDHRFAGPYSDNWQAVDEIPVPELDFAPCGAKRLLNINTELRVQSGTADPNASVSFILLGTDSDAVSHYSLVWRLCGA